MASEITWTRTDFEAGVSYEGEQIASVSTECDAVSNYVEWGDHCNEPFPAPEQADGVYLLRGTGHVFAETGSYAAVATSNGSISKATITVHPRIAISQVTPTILKLRAGSKTSVRITLSAPAPKSNTRVTLQWAGHLAFIKKRPRFIDVPAGLNVVDVEIAATATRPPIPKAVMMTATTNGVGARVEISLG
jgi:hypothetical protein